MSHRAASHLLLVTLKCGPGHIYMVPSVGEEPIDPESLFSRRASRTLGSVALVKIENTKKIPCF